MLVAPRYTWKRVTHLKFEGLILCLINQDIFCWRSGPYGTIPSSFNHSKMSFQSTMGFGFFGAVSFIDYVGTGLSK